LFQGVAFVTFVISSFAETNRTPFDLPEAEQELVAGYLTEYSSIKWALFQMAEYVNMITASAVISTLFMGGFKGPAFLGATIANIPFIWLFAKIALWLFIFIWVRATLPRMRYDKLQQFGWKFLFPVALVNTLATAAFKAFLPNTSPWYLGGFSVIVVIAMVVFSGSRDWQKVEVKTRAVAGD
jgi:NADH-quinone oxidoreductase subunit H